MKFIRVFAVSLLPIMLSGCPAQKVSSPAASAPNPTPAATQNQSGGAVMGSTGFTVVESDEGVSVDERGVITVKGRTEEHRQRLDRLAFEIFDPPLPSLHYGYFRVQSNELYERFGKPNILKAIMTLHRDPGPGGPNIEHLTWEFPGMIMEAVAYPPSENRDPAKVYIESLVVTGSQVPLQNDIRVGQTYSEIVAKLGPPTESYGMRLSYEVHDEIPREPPNVEVVAYSIHFDLDALDADLRVKRIEWEWGAE